MNNMQGNYHIGNNEKAVYQNMNILFIAYNPVFYPVMLSQGLPYISALSKKGIRYSLLTFETKKSIVCSQKHIRELGVPIKWRHLMYHSKPRTAATIFDIILGILTATYTIIKDKITIIHARTFVSALIAFIPAKIFNVKLFFDTRGLLSDKYVSAGLLKKNKIIYKLIRYCEYFLLKNSEIFAVETESHAEVIKGMRNALMPKIRVIPCCVDMSRFDQCFYKSDLEHEFRLVFLGQVNIWYLLDKMLDFFKIASQEFSRARFTFISKSNPDIFYNAAKRIGIDEKSIIVRQGDVKNIPNLLARANVGIFFINPYKQYSTFPIKFGEYLASGLPVIVNNGIGDCDEIIKNENVGVIINDFSTNEYIKSLNAIKVLLKENKTLRKRCRLAAEKYCSLTKGIEIYESIYNNLAKTTI